MVALPGFTKAMLVSEKGTTFEVAYNPESWGYTLSNSWGEGADASGTDGVNAKVETSSKELAQQVFNGRGRGSMSLNLVFDTTSNGDSVYTKYVSKLEKLLHVDSSLERPEWVRFVWGRNKSSFKAHITTLQVNFTYFGQNGLPLRAEVALTLEQFEDDSVMPAQNPTSGTPLPHKIHQVQVGETLDRIAARHFGDSTKWRSIAEANGILDPMTLEPGALLALPDLDGTTYG